MMTFDQCWQSHSAGDYIKVSNGKPEPAMRGGVPWRHWRSHNFTGQIVEKIEADTRSIRFRLPETSGAAVKYDVMDGGGHSFFVSDADAFAQSAIVL